MKNFCKFRGSSVSLLIVAMALVSPLLYVGCNYQVYKAGAGGLKTDGKLKPGEVPDFATVYEQVFSKRCQACHEDRYEELLFDDYEKLAPRLDNVRDSVLHRGNVKPMPKSPEPPLNEQELNLLVGWINAGAPKEKPQPGQSPTPVPPTPTPTPPSTPTPTPTATPAPTPVYVPGEPLPNFEQLKAFALEEKCNKCHDETDDFDLGQYSVFAANAASIKDRVLRPINVRGHMPKASKPQLTWDELSAIVKFIDGGMPEGGAGSWQPPADSVPSPSPTATPAPAAELKPSFASIKEKIFDPKCIGCHTAPKFAGKLYPLGDLAGILAVDSGLIKKDTVHSRLMSAVTRTDEDRMPPANKGAPLTQAEVEILKQWISLGCPL